MIRANHLRVGNWVRWYSTSGWQTVRVNSIIIEKLEEMDEAMEDLRIQPIVLSPEILEKCGFEKDADFPLEPVANRYSLKILGASQWYFVAMIVNQDTPENKKGTVIVQYTVQDFGASDNLKYLHQLQNLYFALTGEELEIVL